MEDLSKQYTGLAQQIIVLKTPTGNVEKFLFAATDGGRLLVSCKFNSEEDVIEAGVSKALWDKCQAMLQNPDTPRELVDASSPNMQVIAQVPIVAL